jgi:hypothetical protein
MSLSERGVSSQRTLQSSTLVDLLDRILDKGLVVAGDIVIQLADVELITIKIRLIVCSVDKAEEIGMDWWRKDAFFSSSAVGQIAHKTKKSSKVKKHILPVKTNTEKNRHRKAKK